MNRWQRDPLLPLPDLSLVPQAGQNVRWAPASSQPTGGPDLLLDDLTLLITEGYAATQRRRGEARDQPRAGYEIFVSAGPGAFAERARIELLATGKRAPKGTARVRGALTAPEAHIARLASRGA